jgi:hypothetical protein
MLNTYNYNDKERVLNYSEKEIMGYTKRLLVVNDMMHKVIDKETSFTESFLKELEKNEYNLDIIEEIRPEYLV